MNHDRQRLGPALRYWNDIPVPGGEDGPMVVGYLFCGAVFGILLAVACLLMGLSALTALTAYAVGGKVGFVASIVASLR
jgi:hypothetical protein